MNSDSKAFGKPKDRFVPDDSVLFSGNKLGGGGGYGWYNNNNNA